MGSGGGNSSPKMAGEVKQLWGMAKPLAQRIATSGLTGQPLWNVPDMPTVPAPVMPNSGWFNSIAPEVRQGLWEPYRESGLNLAEQLQNTGALGSSRAGVSGAAGAALGQLAAEGSRDVGLQAWNMTAPQMMDYRNQLYQSALQQRGDVMQATQAPFTLFPGYLGGISQLPYYATPQQPNPWVGALGGAMGGYAATGSPYGAAAGGVYGYYSS